MGTQVGIFVCHRINLWYCFIDPGLLIMLKFYLIRQTGRASSYSPLKCCCVPPSFSLPLPPQAAERFVKSNRVRLMSLLGDVRLILEADMETEMTSV